MQWQRVEAGRHWREGKALGKDYPDLLTSLYRLAFYCTSESMNAEVLYYRTHAGYRKTLRGPSNECNLLVALFSDIEGEEEFIGF